MKILFLHKWLIMGGIERVLVNYLSILQNEEDLHIDVLLDYDTENNAFHHLIPHNITVHYLFNKQYYTHKENLYLKRKENLIRRINYKILNLKEKNIKRNKLKDYILKGNYDVVINFSNHFDPYINFNKLSCPIVRWQHSSIEEISGKDLKILDKYDKIIAICEDMKNQLLSWFSTDKIDVLFNPIDLDKILELSDKPIPIKLNFYYFIQVSRLDKKKNISDLINIFSKIVNKGIRYKLIIIGNGEEFSNLQILINELDLQNDCLLLGEIENPYPYIKNAELFLHTSEKEGLPTVLLESMALNTPVVAMNCPTGPREILDNGNCGELIELGNKEEFILKTLRLLEDQDKIQSYKDKMTIHIKKFSGFEIKKQFLSLLHQLNRS